MKVWRSELEDARCALDSLSLAEIAPCAEQGPGFCLMCRKLEEQFLEQLEVMKQLAVQKQFRLALRWGLQSLSWRATCNGESGRCL